MALAEMSVAGGRGARIDLRKIPASEGRPDDILFSESHGRFVLATDDPKADVSAPLGAPHRPRDVWAR